MPRNDLKSYIRHLTKNERLKYDFEYNQAKWCRARYEIHYCKAKKILRQARARAQQQAHKEAAE